MSQSQNLFLPANRRIFREADQSPFFESSDPILDGP
jgi:hypothetical protein